MSNLKLNSLFPALLASLRRGSHEFFRGLFRLFCNPIFLFVTLWGHLVILLGASLLYHFEGGINPGASSFLNSYYWAISMVTTTGASEAFPVTAGGKFVGIVLMVLGSLFLWSYTALFAASFLAPQVNRVTREMADLESGVQEVEAEIRIDHAELSRLLHEVESMRETLRRLQESRRI